MPSQHNNAAAAAASGSTAANNTQQRAKKSTNTSSSITLNGSAATKNSIISHRKPSAKEKERERNERDRLVLWRKPITTFEYCLREIFVLLQIYWKKYTQYQNDSYKTCINHFRFVHFRIFENKTFISGVTVVLLALAGFYHIPGPHQIVYALVRTNLWFVLYWVGLGVLSSVGLGTGLHTFLLYLGPHIASVTLAAYECNSLDFPRPPYPDE